MAIDTPRPERDPLAVVLQDAFEVAVKAGHVRRGIGPIMALLPQLRAVLPQGDVTGAVADALLRDWIHAAEGYAKTTLASYWAPYRWLWYLRRISDQVFQGHMTTTQRYDRALTEVLCTTGGVGVEAPTIVGTDPEGRQSVGYPVDVKCASTLAFACGIGIATSQLHANLRWIGKGAALRIRRGHYPEIVASSETRAAVIAYDERVAAARGMSQFIGTFTDSFRSESGRETLFLVQRAHDPYALRLSLLIPEAPEGPTLEATYTFHKIELDGLADLMRNAVLADTGLWDSELPDLIALLHLCLLLVVRKSRYLLKTVMCGYDLVSANELANLFDDARPEVLTPLMRLLPAFASGLAANGDVFVDRLRKMAGRAWPLLPGPVVAQANDTHLAVNVGSAADRLVKLLQMPRAHGDVANIRSAGFEQSVQAAINDSPWCPPHSLRGLVGRVLRIGGQAIGDVDALALKNGVTILISCKARLYTAEYDAGLHAVVRNVAAGLAEDLAAWDSFIARLGASRIGDNYDLSMAGRIVGVVVTPHVMFVEPAVLGRIALPGLRSYSSADELVKWLYASGTVMF